MEVVLQENFPSLGYVGDKVNVKPGYARNYLIPRGIALESSSGNAKAIRHKMSIVTAKKAKLKAQALEEAKKYEGLTLEFTLKIGEKGKSFGSVSLKDIEKSLAEKGFTLDRKQLELKEQIKAGGDYTLDVTLHSEVTVPVTIRVVVERLEKKADKDAGERKGRGRKAKFQEGEEQSEEMSASEESAEEEKPRAKKSKKSEEAKEEPATEQE